jgi:hypothetical protein
MPVHRSCADCVHGNFPCASHKSKHTNRNIWRGMAAGLFPDQNSL